MDELASGEKPANYPTEAVETIQLKDGLEARLRPILQEDAPRLQAGFRTLSPQTVYLRFLQAFRELSDQQARLLATVDYEDRMALVAEIQGPQGPFLIGVARYAKVGAARPGVAEVAIVVGDEYQNRGLGTIMLARLVHYARQHGVSSFLATMHQSNNQIMRFVRKSGFPFERKFLEPGVWEVIIHLTGDLPVGP